MRNDLNRCQERGRLSACDLQPRVSRSPLYAQLVCLHCAREGHLDSSIGGGTEQEHYIVAREAPLHKAVSAQALRLENTDHFPRLWHRRHLHSNPTSSPRRRQTPCLALLRLR